MSASFGAVSVANVEDLLNDRLNSRERVELPSFDRLQDAPQLGVARDRLLEVRLRPRRGDGEHLAGEVPSPPLLEPALALQVRAMLLDPFPQLGHVLLAQRLGEHDRRPPWAFAVERADGA